MKLSSQLTKSRATARACREQPQSRVPSQYAFGLEVPVSHPSQPGDNTEHAALRAQFDAEVLAADLTVPDADREHLFAMWAEHLPLRDSLRLASIAPAEEPSFTQKPAQLGAGSTPTGSGSGGAS
jgi:hypothetical protein